MSDVLSRTSPPPRRWLVLLITTALVSTLLSIVLPATPAAAVGTVLFDNKFNNSTVDGTGTAIVPSPTSGTNVACLSAAGNASTPPLLSCPSSTSSAGSGKLRLTSATTNQIGGVYGGTSFPTSNGLDVTFNSYQYGSTQGADGMSFVLAAVDPANATAPTSIGPGGGSLGYSPSGSVRGLPNAYLGVGLDVYGNFSSTGFQGTGCTNVSTITSAVAGAVVVRGPGNGLAGYCGLTTTYNGTRQSQVTLRASTQAASKVPVQVLINPTTGSFTSDSGVTVSAGTYKVVVTPVGTTAKTLTGPLPAAPTNLYPASSWINSGGVPKQLAFGFIGSTGSVVDFHEASDVRVLTFDQVPQLSVATTSYVVAAPAAGDPVSYVVNAGVQAGPGVTQPVSVTQTTPAGVRPLAAYGSGWVCATPVGQSVTCTTTGSSFAGGSSLPPLKVVAIATGSAVTPAVVQNGSSTTVSSADSSAASASSTTAGTTPSPPSGVALSPASGPVAGGTTVTLSGSNITAATAVEIGTAAEFQAGTPVTLLPCATGDTSECFVANASTLTVYAPARASAATVLVKAVTLGVAGSAGYVYVDRPAAPAAPTASAGITSATVSWVAPAANGSAITGYVVTPYRAGVAQTPVTYSSTATTQTLSGLTAGSSYTFTVAAVNGQGTSAASPASTAVTPYDLPGAPTIGSVAARTSGASVSWTAPSGNGSAITGYVVTPYIGTTAQAPQTFSGSATTQTLTGLTPGTAYTFAVAAQNSAGTGPQSARSPAVTPNASPTLTFAAPPPGEVGVAYSSALTATGGTSPYAWSVSSGALPAGLTLNASTGLLSGTPTASGTFDLTVQVVDASGVSATRAVTLVISPALALTFAPTAGEVSVAYSHQPVRTGGSAPYSWAVTAGSLPAGVTLNTTTGLISGTPTVAGSFSVTIAVTDAFQTVSRTGVVVVAALPTISSGPPDAGQIGVAYSSTFVVSGGTGPVVWSVSAGTLPPGLSLNSASGVLSGTPTTAGSSSFTVQVTDAYDKTATKAVTLVVNPGPLVITKASNVSSVAPGGRVAYTITVSNTGTAASTGVAVSDPLTGVLDDATYNADAAASGGTVSYASSTLSWSGNLAAGASATITYSVTATSPGSGNKVLTNTVSSATLGTNCAPSSSDPRCVATVTVSGLTVVHTAGAATTTPGSTVGFSIVATNSGQTPYAGAALTESLATILDDATYNGNAVATSGSVAYSGSTLSWTGNLAVGASVTITYSVTVANPDVGDRSLTGTVVSPTAGSTCPSSGAAASCTASVTVLVPALSITTTAGSATTTPGSTVTYTLAIANTGQTPYTGAAVTLALSAALDDATYGSASATAGTVVFDAGPGTLVWSGNLAVGASATVTATVTVRDPDPADRVLTAVASSAAPGSTCPAGSATPACTSTVQVRVPQLTITKSSNVTSTTPGSVVAYTVVVTNSGQTAYTGATFADGLAGVLDDATYDNDAVATAGAASFGGQTVSWTGNLAVGASATLTYSVTVRNPDPADKTLSSQVVSTTPGATCPSGSSDPRCASVVTVLVPALSITTTTDKTTATPGEVVRYSIAVQNTGQTAYTSVAVALDFLDVDDDATNNGDGTISTGSLQQVAGGRLVWTLSLAPGASATSSTSFTVNPSTTRGRSMTSTVSSDAAGSTCPTGSTSTACRTTVAVLIPQLTITKTAGAATVQPGGTVGYTVVVANTGESTYPAAGFTDALPGVLDDATYDGGATASTGTVSYASPNLSWTGALAPGATATITYQVTVRDPDPGDKRMAGTVTSTSAGSNCAGSSTDPRCSAVVDVLVPALTIAKTASASSTVPGATVGYTVTVTNSGATPYTGATFTDALGGVLDDATYRADAAATSGTVGYSDSVLSWTGNLDVGSSATITYSVAVRTAEGGDNLLSDKVVSATTGSNCRTGSTDPRCTVTVPVARLLLVRTVPQATTTPGSVVRFPVTFTNTGKVPYVGISVTMPRKDSADDVYATEEIVPSSGSIIRTAEASVWTGDIPVGGVVTIPFNRTAYDPPTGDRHIKATIFSNAPGNNCPPTGGSDPRCSMDILVLVPGVTITKSASTTSVEPGGRVDYTVTVQNSGETPYAGSVTDSLAGVLDDAVLDGDPVASVGSVSYAGATLTWTGSLPVGATATVTYSVTVNSPGTGDKNLASRVTSTDAGSTCPPGSGNAGCVSNVTVLTPGLTLTTSASTASTTLGATVVFSVVVANTGQTSYPAATFSDPLGGVLDDATYLPGATTASSGAVAYDSGGGVLSWSGALAPGASATISYSVSVNNPSAGDLRLTSTVTSSSDASNCAVGSIDPRCAVAVDVLNSTALSIVKTANVASTVPGGTVVFTLRLTNPTGTTITGATVTDSLTDVLDDATYTGSTANVGVVSFTSPNLTWTGNVAARRTVTVTYTVTVGSAGAGNQLLAATTVSTSPSTSNSCLPGSTDPGCTAAVPVAQLDIAQSVDRPTATPGELVTATGTFTNLGRVDYVGITITLDTTDVTDDAIPEGDTASSGSFVRTATGLTWTGDIPVGTTITTARLLRVKNPDPGSKLLTATHRSVAPGNNCAADSTDPRCTFSVTVLLPGLSVSTTSDRSFVVPNGVVAYTVTVANTGQTPYRGATVTDALRGVLDDATYNADATTTFGTVTFTSPDLTWTGDLDVGQVATVTFTVTAKRPATGDKGMTSSVSSTVAGSSCLPNSGAAGCSNTVDVRSQILTTVATASRATAQPGDLVTYTVTATNDGQTDYATATFDAPLADLLDDALYTGAATATSGTVVRSGDTLVWTGPLLQGARATITYSVTVKDPVAVNSLPGNHRLEQTLTSVRNGSNCLAASTDPRCSTSVPIAGLRIVNVADTTTAKPTDVVHYTGTFTNTGQVPYVGITIADSFVGALDNARYNGDAVATSGNVVIVVGSGRIVWTGDVAVGETVTITGSVTLTNPKAGDDTLSTVITTATPGSNCPATGTAAECRTDVAVLTPALSITKAASTSSATPGETVTYTITATNTGQTAYTAARIEDDLTSALSEAGYDGNATADRGAVGLVGPVLTWTGDLEPTQHVTITYSVVVDSPYLGDGLLLNRVVSDELGSTCPVGGSAGACASSVTVLVPALDISVAADRTTAKPGEAVGYTVTVSNVGQTPYTGATVDADLSEVLDDAVYDQDAASTLPGALTLNGSALTWTGNLAVGASTTITYGVTVKPSADLGNRSLRTSVSSSAAGSRCATATACVSTVQVLVPHLTVSTTAATPKDDRTATPGDRVLFTITVHNDGETPYTNASVSTDLADVVDDATFDGMIVESSGQAGYAGSVLTWTGSLAPGETATITYDVTVTAPGPGADKVLRTVVVADEAGSTCATGSTAPSCTATVTVLVPALSISKSAGVATTTPGGVVGYTILITNSGETPYTGATVVDALNNVLVDATYDANAQASSGQLEYGDGILTWTGDLPVGAPTVAVTYSVTVRDPDPGDKLLANTVTSSAPGSTCPPDADVPACSTSVRVLVPALTITKTADTSQVTAGSPVRYTITVTNTGETPYALATVDDDLVGVLDDATYAQDATATSGSVGQAGNTLTWTGALGLAQTVTITYSVTTSFPAEGDRVLENTASSGSSGASCAPGSADEACSTVVTVVVPELTITKTADTSRVVAGGTVRYTVEATNTGVAAYPAATLSDSLTDVLLDAVYASDATASSGEVSYADGTLSWTGALGRGESVLITYSVLVDESVDEDSRLVNAVVSTSVGSTCPPGNQVPACTTTTEVEPSVLTLTGLTPSFALSGLPGETATLEDAVSMTVTTNNDGGYQVSVQATGPALTPAAGNPDSIPIDQLSVRETGSSDVWTQFLGQPITVHSQDAPSAPGGDAVTNDYQVEIPFVNADTYSTELEYVVTPR